MRDVLRSLEGGRLDPPVIERADLPEGYTWRRGLTGATFRHTRLARQRIQPGFLRRRPRFERWTVDECQIELWRAKSADFIDIHATGLTITGPWETFSDCSFSRCSFDRLKLATPTRSEDCTFTNVDFSILVPDNVVFHRCSFERVTIAGKATGSFLGCSFDATDISGLLLHDSAIRSSRRTDLTLPATPACFYVPGDALRGPLEPIRASVRNHMLQATLNGSLDAGLVVNAEEIRRMGGRGQEADRVVDALWQHHITNLSEATTPVA